LSPSVPSRSHVLRRVLSSRPAEVDNCCREVREWLTENGLLADIFPVELLLRESLNNAMLHGNGGDCARKVTVEMRIGRKWIILRVTDEGAGFNCSKVREAVPDPDATCGRGLAIYALYAQRVIFNSKGNQVSLWRALTGEGKP
jgi:anti-sigma regulatory factor (Ser/Thr protein kinase)